MPRVKVRVSCELVYEQEVPEGRTVELAVFYGRELDEWFETLEQRTVPGDGPAGLELPGHMTVEDPGTGNKWRVTFIPETGEITSLRH